MAECDDMIEYFHAKARDQVHLAVIAEATSVAAMHIDLACYRADQARTADVLCKDQYCGVVRQATGYLPDTDQVSRLNRYQLK